MTARRASLLGTLLVSATLVALISFRSGIGMHDEGLMLQWGSRIGDGQWPYRDFWSNYLPGQALLQSLLGDSLVTWRVVRALTGAVAALCVYLLVERTGGARGWAMAAWFAAALALAWPLTPGPNASAVALALGALLAVPNRPALGGLLAAAALVFRPELGLAALAGVLLLLDSGHARRSALAAWAIATALCLAPFWIAAPNEMLDQVVGFIGIQDMQRLPLVFDPGTTDPNKVLERLFAAALLGCALGWMLFVLARRRSAELLPLVVVSALYLAARSDEFHLVPLSVLLVAAAATTGARDSTRAVRFAMAAIIGLATLHGLDRIAGHFKDARSTEAIGLSTSGGVRTDPSQARALRALARVVDDRTRPGDPVLVLPPRTDRVSVGAPLLYTLLDRSNPTRYDVMQPGVVTTAKVQREIVADMARVKPALVIRWRGARAERLEDNASGRTSGSHILDDAVARQYERLVRVGEFEVLTRDTIDP